MHLGLLSSERLSFDPLKPIILSGQSNEESSVVFSGNVVLSLGKATKVSSIHVTLKSVATTYWPEGIGARGTRLSYDKILNEQTTTIFKADQEKKGYTQLPAGIHKYLFTFVIPNSTVETVEDVYGRVKHSVEARVISPGISLLNSWHISKSVLVLRTYLSNALLTNNSLPNLSRTFEKSLPGIDLQAMVEQAAFSSGDLFHIRLMLQPQMKRVKIEQLELYVIEHRRYCVPEMRAVRTDQQRFFFSFLSATNLDDEQQQEHEDALMINKQWSALFNKSGPTSMDVHDTLNYRLTFATPTCVRNFHHSTSYKDISFKHHLAIHAVVSYPEPASMPVSPNPSTTINHSPSSAVASSSSINTTTTNTLTDEDFPSSSSSSSSSPSTPTISRRSSMIRSHSDQNIVHANSDQQHQAPSSHHHTGSKWLNKLRKQHHRSDKDIQENHSHQPIMERKQESIKFEIPITVYDCRLKEDFGRLPSYSEIIPIPNMTTSHHPSFSSEKDGPSGSSSGNINSSQRMPMTPDTSPPTSPSSSRRNSCNIEAHVFLCPCYFAFRRQVERAANVQLVSPPPPSLSVDDNGLERIPSKPPPQYMD
ncbi:hypothetical protein BJ944DRAFT_289676 [Cunninghamella echinulata]|nr:hypothetical protein BJ944DRAFT_289676 [Cunninghamella echinulata]